jgi:hypothetical protein
MAAIEDVREVADAVASMFRNAYDRWRDLSGAARTERSELLWDSHLAQNFKDRSIAETVYIPVPRFQQLLWAVIDGRHASSNRGDKPLPAMEKIDESPPVHNSIITPRRKPITAAHSWHRFRLILRASSGYSSRKSWSRRKRSIEATGDCPPYARVAYQSPALGQTERYLRTESFHPRLPTPTLAECPIAISLFLPSLSSTASDREAAPCGSAVFCFAIAPVQVLVPPALRAPSKKADLGTWEQPHARALRVVCLERLRASKGEVHVRVC